jgi:hypothetical protein
MTLRLSALLFDGAIEDPFRVVDGLIPPFQKAIPKSIVCNECSGSPGFTGLRKRNATIETV